MSTIPHTSARKARFALFKRIWLGQTLVALTAMLAEFSFGLEVYGQVRTATGFGLLVFFLTLPGIAVSPLAGAVVDRFETRRILACANFASALALGLLLLASAGQGRLAAHWIYGAAAALSCIAAFSWPAYWSLIARWVPPGLQGRASGMVHASSAFALIVAPFAGSLVHSRLGMRGVLVAGVAGYGVAALIAFASRGRARRAQAKACSASRAGAWGEAVAGWRLIAARPLLLMLLGVLVATNFTLGALNALITPLVLGFAGAANLASVYAAGGIGMLLGAGLMSSWGGPARRTTGLFGALLAQALVLAAVGSFPVLGMIQAGAFVFFFATPIALGCNQAMWQSLVDRAVHGRVFAAREMAATSCAPLAALTAGPLSERLAAWAEVSSGRGIGLVLVLLAVLTAASAVLSVSGARAR